LQIILRGNSKGVCHSVEESEHGCDVNGFGNLIFAPACVAQFLNIFRSGTVSGIGDLLNVVEQQALGGREAGFVEFTLENCAYALIIGSLNTQEVGVAVQSIRTAIDVGDVTGDHLLVAASEMAFGEMNRIREVDHLA
jgi:hypothetical protein